MNIYLNEGKGDPWAGQVIPTPILDAIVKADNSNFEENFGFEDPIGSKITEKHQSKLISTWMKEEGNPELDKLRLNPPTVSFEIL